MNVSIFSGEIVSEPRKHNEKAPCTFRLKTRNKLKSSDKIAFEYHNVVIWGKPGDFFLKKYKKGEQVSLLGSIKYENHEYSVKDGQGNLIYDKNGEEIKAWRTNSEIKVVSFDSINAVFLSGKIVSEIEQKNSKAPYSFKLKTSEKRKGTEGYNYETHNVVVWGEAGKHFAKKYKKDDIVSFYGFLKHERHEYEVLRDGQPVLDQEGNVVKSQNTNTEVKVISFA